MTLPQFVIASRTPIPSLPIMRQPYQGSPIIMGAPQTITLQTNPDGSVSALPVSPISGNPIQTSIFQPAQTPSGGPGDSAPVLPQQSAPVAQATGFFGLDTNTWLVLLVVLAAVIAMVYS